MMHCDWQKTIELFNNQSGAAILIGNFEVARKTGFRCCVKRIALWGCFEDEFWSMNFLPRDYKGDREGIPHIHPIPYVIRLELFLESG